MQNPARLKGGDGVGFSVTDGGANNEKSRSKKVRFHGPHHSANLRALRLCAEFLV
jgi:hypothetical protein